MLIERDLVPMDCYWPGTETVVQEVSSAQTLKVSCRQVLDTSICFHVSICTAAVVEMLK